MNLSDNWGVGFALGSAVLTGFACWGMIRRDRIWGFVFALMAGVTVLAWVIPQTFFFLFSPQSAYGYGRAYAATYASGYAKVQGVTLLFLIGVTAAFFAMRLLVVAARLQPRSLREEGLGIRYGRMVIAVIIYFVVSFAVIYLRATGTEGWITYVVGGLFLYSTGIPLLLGRYWSAWPSAYRTIGLLLLGMLSVLFVLGNARLYAMLPWLAIGAGFWLGARGMSRRALLATTVLAALLPFLYWIGESTRSAGWTPAFDALDERADVVWHTLHADQFVPGLVFGDFIGRMFPTLGHNIILRVPSRYPYWGWDPFVYTRDVLVQLPPRELFRPGNYDPYRVGRQFGFNVGSHSNVGVTLLGHFWYLGGPVFVLFGGFATGGVLAAVALFLGRVSLRSEWDTMACLAFLLPALLMAYGSPFPEATRRLVWSCLIGICVVVLLRIRVSRDDGVRNGQRWSRADGDEAGRRSFIGGVG